MIKAEIRSNINFPKTLISQDDLVFMAERIIIPDIVRGIDAKRAIDGGSLPDNEPATIKRKGVNRPLIDTGTLRSEFFAKLQGKSKVIISIGSERKEIGGYLQKGIETKKGLKRYKFFGISQDASKAVINYARNRIKEVIANAR